MATILIVDDRAGNREYLLTLLGYGGHRLLEAENGAVALALVRAERPDLVITDILMPALDGYELAQLVRADPDPALARTPIIFYTATYGSREARALAQAAQVHYLLMKPAKPQLVLDTVNAALGLAPPLAPKPETGPLEDPLRVVSAKLAEKMAELRGLEGRLGELVAALHVINSERDPERILSIACQAAGNILNARYAAIGILDDRKQGLRHFVTSGIDPDTIAQIGPLPSGKGVLGRLLAEGKPLRLADLAADPSSVGFPPGHPPMRSFLGVPLTSPTGLLGRLYLTEKTGAAEFSDDDERLAIALGAQIAVAYENALRYDETQSHAAALQLEVTQRTRAEVELARSEERFRSWVENAMDLISVVDAQGLIQYESPSVERLLGYTAAELVGTSAFDLVHLDDQSRLLDLFTSNVSTRGAQAIAEFRLRDRSGAWRDFEATGKSIEDEHGDQVGLIYSRDISERKRAEAAQARLVSIIEATPDFVGWSTADGQVVYINRAGREMIGLKAGEGIADSRLSDYVPAWANYMILNDGIRTAMAQGSWTGESALLTRDGREIPVSAVILAHLAPDGSLQYLSTVMRDISAIRQAEAALRESEDLFRYIFDHSLVGMVLTTPTGAVTVNEAFAQMVGYTPAELQDHAWKEITHPDDVALSQEKVAAILASEVTSARFTKRYVHKSGAIVWADVSTSLRRDPDGQPLYFVTSVSDITESRQAEQRIRYLATVLEAVPDGIVSTDSNLDIVSWNAGAEAMFGYRAEEVVGRPYSKVIAYDFAEGGEIAALQAIAETGHWQGEVRVRHKDGKPIYVLVAGAVLKDSSGTATGFSAVLHDITERRQFQDRLRLQSDAMAAAVDGMVITDNTGIITWVNPAFTRLTGYASAEAVGQNPRVLKSGRHDEAFYRTLWTTVLAGKVWSGELVNRRKDGSLYDEEMTITPIEAETGVITHFVAIKRDVSERKQRARELEAIVAVSTALRLAHTAAEMLPILLDQLTILLDTGTAAIGLEDPVTGELVAEAVRGEASGLVGTRLPRDAGIPGHVLATLQPFVTADVTADPRFLGLFRPVEARAAAYVPLIAAERAFGVMWIGRANPFLRDEVRVLSAIADIAASALRRAVLHEQTEVQLSRLTSLREIDSAIMNSLDLRTTLMVVLGHVMSQLGVDAAAILLLSRGTHELEFAAGRGFRTKAIDRTRLRLGQGHSGLAALERRLVSVNDIRSEPSPFMRAELLAPEAFVSLYCVPLVAKGQLLGVLEVWHRSPLRPNDEWLAFFQTLGGQAAIAVADARLFADLQRSNTELLLAYDTTLEGWSAALDLRDKETEGHSQRVTEMSTRLGQQMGLREAELEQMRRGALLHDIGKMGVPDAILLKPGPLTDEEWVIMRKHPTFAYQLLSHIAFLRPALDIPYCHHEKWDGSGYPRQLKGDQIPFAARIFAVVDVWDALRSDRTYRAGWPDDKVIVHINSLSGTHFDPRVVTAFLAMIG